MFIIFLKVFWEFVVNVLGIILGYEIVIWIGYNGFYVYEVYGLLEIIGN